MMVMDARFVTRLGPCGWMVVANIFVVVIHWYRSVRVLFGEGPWSVPSIATLIIRLSACPASLRPSIAAESREGLIPLR